MKNILIITIISTVLLLISTLIPVKINNSNEATDVSFWFPLKFISQDITVVEYEYPIKTHILSKKDNPTKINIIHLIFSLIFYYIFTYSAYIFLNKYKRNS